MRPIVDVRNKPSIVERNLAAWPIPTLSTVGAGSWEGTITPPADVALTVGTEGGPGDAPFFEMAVVGEPGEGSGTGIWHHMSAEDYSLDLGVEYTGSLMVWASREWSASLMVVRGEPGIDDGDSVSILIPAESWTQFDITWLNDFAPGPEGDFRFGVRGGFAMLSAGDVVRITRPIIVTGATPVPYFDATTTPLARQEPDGTTTLWQYGA